MEWCFYALFEVHPHVRDLCSYYGNLAHPLTVIVWRLDLDSNLSVS
jgi:hypothetical protein